MNSIPLHMHIANAVRSSAGFLHLQPFAQPFLHLHETSSQQGFDALSSLVHTHHPCFSPSPTGWQKQLMR